MSERRDSSWIDYSNLAANLVQIGQLSAVQGRLKALAQIEVAREERTRLLNDLRQIVFEAEEGLQRVGKYITIAPKGVLIAVSILKTAFDEMGITPQAFEEFADKDRVKHARELIQEIIENSSQTLTTAQNDEVIQVLQLVPKLDMLELLIRSQDAKEKLAKTKDEWKQLEEQNNRASRPWSKLILVSLIAFPVGLLLIILIFTMIFGPNSQNQMATSIAMLLICILSFLVIAGIIVGLLGANGAYSQRSRELNKERTNLTKHLLPAAKLKELYNEFGEKTSNEYSALRDETVEYIRLVTQQDAGGADLPESLLSMVMPSKILQQEISQ